MNIQEAKQRIIEIEPIFGQRALDYFDRLNLENISARTLIESKDFSLFGFKKIENKPNVTKHDFLSYSLGYWDSEYNGILFAMGKKENMDNLPSKNIVTFNNKGTYGPNLNIPGRLRDLKDIEFAISILDKVIDAHQNLFS